MYDRKFLKIIFIKQIIYIENNEVIQPWAKFEEDRIMSFWINLCESSINMVLRKTCLKFQKVKTQWVSWLTD